MRRSLLGYNRSFNPPCVREFSAGVRKSEAIAHAQPAELA
jgi:hypothetical protein